MENLSHFEETDESLSHWGTDVDEDRKKFLEEVKKYEPNADIELIGKAFDFCVKYHLGILRKSGLPYYTHPINVSMILLQEFPIHDTVTIVCALLHDTIEDCETVTREMLSEEFSPEVGKIVEALTKIKHENISKDATGSKERDKALTYRKLFLSLVEDTRVIIIKIADRVHNMRTLKYMKPYKQADVALETLNFYVPFSHRLGLMKIKMELENRSFFYYDNKRYEEIREELNKKRWSFIDYINVFSNTITEALNEHNIEHIISVVHKHEYEIYTMLQEGKSFKDIDNFYSLVIILDSNNPNDCYGAYGVLTNAFNTVQFLDEIAHSTVDWYQSLRLDVMGPDGKRIEILIRTQEMERIADEGFLSSFTQDREDFRALSFSDEDIDEWGSWMEEIIEIDGEKAARTIWNSLKVNIFDSALSVFTKTGEEINLPKGSSLLDFAFALYGDEAIHTIAGKVNGKTVDYKYRLQPRDQIEILKTPKSLPDEDWNNHIVYYKSVAKLYYYFKNNTLTEPKQNEKKRTNEIHLRIEGEDRNHMLSDITDVIGRNDIKRIYLGATEADFEGNLTIRIEDEAQINHLFLRLFEVKGISSVTLIDSNNPTG